MSPEEAKQVAAVVQGVSFEWMLGISGAILVMLGGILWALIVSIYKSKSKDIAKNTENITQLTLDIKELTVVLREDTKATAIANGLRDEEIKLLKSSRDEDKQLWAEELDKVTKSFLQLTDGDPEIKADLEKWMDERILIVEGDVEIVKEEMVKLNGEWGQFKELKLGACEKKGVVLSIVEHMSKDKLSKS